MPPWFCKRKIIDLKNVNMFSNHEVYCENCLSAKKLGVEAYKSGAIAYWCYIEDFVFTTEALYEFRMFANAGLKFWLEGNKWEKCQNLLRSLQTSYAKNSSNQENT